MKMISLLSQQSDKRDEGRGVILPMEMVLEAHTNSIAYEDSLTSPPYWRGLIGPPNSTSWQLGMRQGDILRLQKQSHL